MGLIQVTVPGVGLPQVGQRGARLPERQSAARFPVTFHNPFKVANPALSYPSSIPLQQAAPHTRPRALVNARAASLTAQKLLVSSPRQ